MKVASFAVRADPRQSIRWKQAASSYGHASVGVWLAEAADRFLDGLIRAGKPLPLGWTRGRFRVRLEDGTEPELAGWVARPFGHFHGSPQGPIPHGSTKTHSLVLLSERRILATFHYARLCRVLAAELVVPFARGEHSAASALVERHIREQV
jgi:hypothetical protein